MKAIIILSIKENGNARKIASETNLSVFRAFSIIIPFSDMLFILDNICGAKV